MSKFKKYLFEVPLTPRLEYAALVSDHLSLLCEVGDFKGIEMYRGNQHNYFHH